MTTRLGNSQKITKKIIDLMIDFLRDNFHYNRLYNNIKITDRFSMTSAQLPCIIIRQTTNNSNRIHFDDFMFDIHARVKLTPLSADDTLVGNNVVRTNLPMTVDWHPLWPYDNTLGVPSGTDISQIAFTSGLGPFGSGVDTGVIITIPPPTTFQPSSILYVKETPVNQWYYPGQQSWVDYSGTYNIGIGRTGEQFYLIYSGSTLSGVSVMPVGPDDYIVDPSGLSGVTIKLNDVLFAGDQYMLETFTEDNFVGERYGGTYDVTVNFDLYADSTLELQELADFTERFLVEKKFDLWDKAGFNTKEWSKGSESEKAYLNEFIFQASITTAGYTEWFEDRSVELIKSMRFYPIPIGGYDVSGNSVQMMYLVPSGTVLPAFSGTIWPSGNWAPVGPSGEYIQVSGETYTSIYNQFFPYSYPFVLPSSTTLWWLRQ